MRDMLDGNSFAEWTPTPCKQTIAQETGAALPNLIWFLFYFQAQGHTASPRSFTELRMLLHYSEEGMDSELTVCRWELSLSQPPSRLISSPHQLLLLAILKTFMAIWLPAFLILTLMWQHLILVSHSNLFIYILSLNLSNLLPWPRKSPPCSHAFSPKNRTEWSNPQNALF